MKISKLEVFILRRPLRASMRISRGGFKVRTHAIVRLTTDEGIVGLGEGIGNAGLIGAISQTELASRVQGLDPFEIEKLRTTLLEDSVYFERMGSVVCAISAIEMACWDIKGKALNVPCYELLGGLFRDRIEAYASDIYWEESSSSIAANAERIANLGYKTIKAHLGCDSPKKELERIRSIRRAIGEEVGLMVDLNCGYDLPRATDAVRLWEPENLVWIEEPLKPDHIDAMSALRQKSRIPIASGENEFRVAGFHHLLSANAVDVVMPDIGRAGGLLETKSICTLAAAHGVSVSPHNFSSGVLLAATLHLLASTPNASLVEMDTSGNAVYEELLVSPIEFRDGAVSVPRAPGLGVELNEELISRYCDGPLMF